MSIIGTIVIGFIVGLLARFVMPGRDPFGVIVTILLGIAGAFCASLLGQSMGLYRSSEPAGFVASVLGAVLLLAVYRAFTGRRHRLAT